MLKCKITIQDQTEQIYENIHIYFCLECEDIEAGAKKFVISSPTETFINTCTGKEEKSNECFCKVPISRSKNFPLFSFFCELNLIF